MHVFSLSSQVYACAVYRRASLQLGQPVIVPVCQHQTRRLAIVYEDVWRTLKVEAVEESKDQLKIGLEKYEKSGI